MSYIPPYDLSDKIISLVADISEKVGKITERAKLDSKPHLRKNNKIKSVYSSLAIEANSLSLDEVRDVIDGRFVIGKKREIQEVKNAYSAYEQIGQFDVYSVTDLKRMHGVMTKYLVSESGEFRKGEEGVFNGDKCIFMAPPAKFVPEQTESLLNWMKSCQNKVHPLIMAAVFHYEFVFIHPFTDGNGRMARLWHTAILTAWNPIFEFIPLESQIEKFQDGYYNAISKCHVDGKSTAFIEFILEQINCVLSEILNVPSYSSHDTASDCVRKLLDVMDSDVSYSANEILSLLNMKSKEALRKNYLNPAIESGFVRMTLPEKPKSKNQRYIKS